MRIRFSFCVCLYQALYGARPFDGETTTELREAISVGRFSEPPSHAHVPRWMRQALVRGLSADPAARYPSMAELLRALQADPRIARARWLPLVATGALLVVAAVGWQLARRRQVRACAGAEDRLAGVWDNAQRTAVRTAFRASGKPFAEAALSTVERVFDGYAHAWVAMHVDACEATHVRGEQSGELLDLRMTCLNDWLTQLKTLSELFATADAAVVERAAQSAQSLPRLEPCADAAQLRAPIPPPQGPQARQRVDEVRQRLARVHALGLAARFDEGLELVRSALRDVQTLQYPALEAEAQLELGQLLDERGDYRGSADAQYQALVMALGGRHDRAAANAALALFTSVGVHQAHYDEGDHWAGVAEALARRLHENDDTLGMVYSRRSTLRWSEGRYDEALEDAKRALALQLRVLGPDHYLVAETYHHLGNIYDTRGDSAQALDYYQRAVAIMQSTLGPDHRGSSRAS